MTIGCLADLTPTRVRLLQSEQVRLELDGYLAYAEGGGESAGTVRYLAGWMPSTSQVLLYVPTVGQPVLISDDKNRARAFAGVLADRARVVKTTDLFGALAALSAGWPAGARVGLAGVGDLTSSRRTSLDRALPDVETLDAEAVVTGLRAVRTEEEAARQQAATRVADAMVQRAMQVAVVPGMTGTEMMAEVEYTGRRMGADKAGCWLALGERPAETYFETFELASALAEGDRVQIGTTVLHGGYFSQVLRIGVVGEPTAALNDTVDALTALQDAALASMTPGAPVTVVGDVLEAGIDRLCPYPRAADPFRFQSCHALGNSYSEPWSAPYLNADRDRSGDDGAPLVGAHQTFEIHPNFSLPELGHVCAGDVAVVGKDGARWQSQTPRGLLRLS